MSTRRGLALRFSVLAALSIALLFAGNAAPASATVKPVAWGCGGLGNWGQCTVPSNLSDVSAIAAGQYYGLALKDDGTIAAWGCGLLGLEGACNVPSGLSGVTRIAGGRAHALALKGDGTVVAWGKSCIDIYTNFGQCNLPAGLSDVTAIAAADSHSLALKADGTVVAWGCGTAFGLSRDFGQCAVPGGLTGVTAIAAAFSHSLALKADGTVVAWGCTGMGGNYGQCSVPNDLSGVTAIAAGAVHSLALKADGSVVAWGCSINDGQCSVPNGLTSVTAIAAHDYHSVALKGDGSVVAWGCVGANDHGQCSVPIGVSRVTAIAAGRFHTLALIELLNQTMTFGPLANKTYGDPDFTVSATASSGLPVSFAASGSCTVSGATVHLTGVGSCTVTASQPGDANYAPAPNVTQGFAVAKASQSITFGPLPGKTFGDPDFAVSATASSGLPVVFAGSGSCTVSGATVHLGGAGSCTVTASQPGDVNYEAAPDVSQRFAVAKAGQSITFGLLGGKTFGAPDFTVTATASSGLPVSFAASGNCAVTGATVHLTGAGSCTVTVSQLGDVNYNAAPDVSRSFSIAPTPCTVPNVVGKQVASARRTIGQRHCRTGKVSYAYSRKRRRGVVISQSRRPGRVLPARSKVDLIVSRGRRR